MADYCDWVYHSILTDEQQELLDNLQNHALRLIFGTGIMGRKLRVWQMLTALREGRIEHCNKFVLNCVNSDSFCDWFPLKGSLSYKEE